MEDITTELEQIIDLRSDTFTKPTSAMRAAIADAEVGDDMVGEDPTVNLLEAYCCELFGKPAAVFCCSATQANQAAVWSHCRPGDQLLIEDHGHIANYEGGAPAALSGVSVCSIPGNGGLLDLDDLAGCLKGPEQHYPTARLLCLENSTNIGGGRAYQLAQIERVTAWGRDHGLKLHLDGARVFNACLAGGYTPHQLASHFDTVSVCFSKGLGCPMGAILLGDEATIGRARRARKIFGGALRQAGIVAAAAVYALQNHRQRLIDDHANARRLAEKIAHLPGLKLDLDSVETNMLFFEVDPELMTGSQLAERLSQHQVRMFAVGPQRLRAVTHLDVTTPMIDRAAQVIETVLSDAMSPAGR